MSVKFLPLAYLIPLLLLGCGSSPPNNYYLLSAQEFPAPKGEAPALGVGPIAIPEYLNRAKLVYKRLDNSLQVAGSDLWAEPLSDGIQRVLVLNLAGLLDTQDVRSFPWHQIRTPDYGVKVNLLQLDANAQEAQLTAEWLVYRPADDTPVKRRISKLHIPLSSGAPEPEAVAAAYSTLLFQLSEIIAGVITADRSGESNTVEP